MKPLYRDLGDYDFATITPIGDLHVGNEAAEARFLRERDYILAAPNRFCIVNGDMMNLATPISVESVADQDFINTEQFIAVAELFRPLAKAGRILLWNDGNHENRAKRYVELIPGRLLTHFLGIEAVYTGSRRLGQTGLLHVDLGKNSHGRRNAYILFVFHGFGGGRRAGAGINKAEDASIAWPACHFIIMSHMHREAWIPTRFPVYDRRTKTLTTYPCHLVVSPAFKDYGGFEEERVFVRGGGGIVRAWLSGREWATKVETEPLGPEEIARIAAGVTDASAGATDETGLTERGAAA